MECQKSDCFVVALILGNAKEALWDNKYTLHAWKHAFAREASKVSTKMREIWRTVGPTLAKMCI